METRNKRVLSPKLAKDVKHKIHHMIRRNNVLPGAILHVQSISIRTTFDRCRPVHTIFIPFHDLEQGPPLHNSPKKKKKKSKNVIKSNEADIFFLLTPIYKSFPSALFNVLKNASKWSPHAYKLLRVPWKGS